MIPVRPSQQYVPRVYGFKISQQSLYFRNHEDDAPMMSQNDNRSSRRASRSRQGGGGGRRWYYNILIWVRGQYYDDDDGGNGLWVILIWWEGVCGFLYRRMLYLCLRGLSYGKKLRNGCSRRKVIRRLNMQATDWSFLCLPTILLLWESAVKNCIILDAQTHNLTQSQKWEVIVILEKPSSPLDKKLLLILVVIFSYKRYIFGYAKTHL